MLVASMLQALCFSTRTHWQARDNDRPRSAVLMKGPHHEGDKNKESRYLGLRTSISILQDAIEDAERDAPQSTGEGAFRPEAEWGAELEAEKPRHCRPDNLASIVGVGRTQACDLKSLPQNRRLLVSHMFQLAYSCNLVSRLVHVQYIYSTPRPLPVLLFVIEH